MLIFAMDASNGETKLELTEMAAVFQRLALREEHRANNLIDFPSAQTA